MHDVNGANFCCYVCFQWKVNNPIEKGGMDLNTGQPLEVEIDETYFLHQKYHCGAFRLGRWVFDRVESLSWSRIQGVVLTFGPIIQYILLDLRIVLAIFYSGFYLIQNVHSLAHSEAPDSKYTSLSGMQHQHAFPNLL